jgi:hypothetical protein
VAKNQAFVEEIGESHVHTNHFVSGAKEVKDNPSESSKARYERASELVKPNMTPKSMMDLLSDKKNKEFPICRDQETIASLVFDLGEKTLYLAKGHPCEGEYSRYSLI